MYAWAILHARYINSELHGITDETELLNIEYVLSRHNEKEWLWFVCYLPGTS